MKNIYQVLLYLVVALGLLMPFSQRAEAQFTACPKIVQKAAINITGTGDATVITGDANRKIYVWQFFMVNGHATQDVNITLKEGATSVSGAYLLVHLGGSHTGLCTGTPWASVPAGSNFVINTSASGSVQGEVYYTQEP